MNQGRSFSGKTLTALVVAVSVFLVAARGQAQWTPADGSGNISNTNSGNVGIGGTPPTAKFHLFGTAILDGLYGGIYTTAAEAPFTATGLLLRAKASKPYVVVQTGTSDDASAFVVYSPAALSLFRVTGAGNVAVGAGNPVKKLHVFGDSLLGGGTEIVGNNSASQFKVTSVASPPGVLSALSYTQDNVSIGFGVDFSAGGWVARDTTVAWLYKQGGVLGIWGSAGNVVGQPPAMNQTYFNVNLASGNVGMGTSAPATKLHVVGDATITGTLIGGNIQAKYQDVAEWVSSSTDLPDGTVVVLDPADAQRIARSSNAYDQTVAGVISPLPGLLLGEAAAGREKVATFGRVRVNAEALKRPIRMGDLLVTSDIPGRAMASEAVEISGRKFHQPGTILGKALEPLPSGVGEILVLLSLQ